MIFQILSFGGLKVAAWLWTLKSVASVDEMVCFQLAFVCSGKPTDVAQVVLGGAVCDHVIFKGMLPFETISTNLSTHSTEQISHQDIINQSLIYLP